LSDELPQSIHLQGLSALDSKSTQAIVRLVHIYANGEDPFLSRPVTIDFTSLFSMFSISNIVETTVSANKVIGMVPPSVTINPSEIRTFVVTFS